MKKLLHEKLRGNYIGGCTSDRLAGVLGYEELECKGICDECTDSFFKKLADEIERQYVTLPCDPEGKPWNIGDPVSPLNAKIDSHITGFIYDGEEWYLQYRLAGRDNKCNELAKNCKRPQPKVFDADGVEIKVGDTVWSIDGFKKSAEVTSLKDGVLNVYLRNEDGAGFTFESKRLTHKEPDSLNKAVSDMREYIELVGLPAKPQFDEWIDRLAAIIERGA